MNEAEIKNQTNLAIAEVLGIDLVDILDTADFELDFNASPLDMDKIKSLLETRLDITLPDFKDEAPQTVADLYALVYDSSL